MKLTATLFCFNSKRDQYGNCYWAFRFVDHKTGKEVCATSSGGGSNINAIRLYWGNEKGWDSSIQVIGIEKGIRDFNQMTKDWALAGCDPKELADFIRKNLTNPQA